MKFIITLLACCQPTASRILRYGNHFEHAKLGRCWETTQKLNHLKKIPIEQFFEGMNQLGQVRPMEVRPFPWWGLLFDSSRNCNFIFVGILIHHRWGYTIAGWLSAARMKSRSRGTRSDVLYSSSPDRDPKEQQSMQKYGVSIGRRSWQKKKQSMCQWVACAI